MNIKWVFVFSFQNRDHEPTRNYFVKHYMPSVEIKDFNSLIDNKPFFDQNKHVEMSGSNVCAAGNLFKHLYHQICHKLTCIDLSR